MPNVPQSFKQPAALVFGSGLLVVVTFVGTMLCGSGCAGFDLRRAQLFGDIVTDVAGELRAQCAQLTAPAQAEAKAACERAADKAAEVGRAGRELDEAIRAFEQLARRGS